MTGDRICLSLAVLISCARLSKLQTNSDEYSYRLLSSFNEEGVGYLDVSHGDTFGRICPDDWDNRDALVVCKELGFEHGTAIFGTIWSARYLRHFRIWSAPYLLHSVNCSGSETSLWECSFASGSTCEGKEYAGIHCYNFDVILSPPGRPYGAVALNTTPVPLFQCSDGFDQNAASVVCKQLGFKYGLAACCSVFGWNPASRFTTDTIKCLGTEKRLSECKFLNDVGDRNCTRTVTIGDQCNRFYESDLGDSCEDRIDFMEDCDWGRYAGVVCTDEARGMTSLTADPIVKINYFTHDGYVCSEEFTDKDASVVCRSVGYSYGVAFKASSYDIRREIRWLRGLDCNGTETSIEDCNHHEWGQTQSCQWDRVAGVMCSNNQGDLDVKVRVVDGHESNTLEDTSISGRVEIHLNGRWGTICGRHFGISEARVLCRHLGYLGAEKSDLIHVSEEHFYILSGMECDGNEASMKDCVWYGYHSNVCACSWPASVRCFKPVRLTNTRFQSFGMLEMFDYGDKVDEYKWWAVCDASKNLDPVSICEQWGFPSGVFREGSALGPNSAAELSEVLRYCGDIADSSCLTNTFSGSCASGNYLSLYCSRTSINNEELAVSIPSFPKNPSISFYGPVTVKRYGHIGYICNKGFDNRDARVICSELGFISGLAVKTFATDLAIIQDDVECTGSEKRLEDCKRGTFANDLTCLVSDTVAGVICYRKTYPQLLHKEANYTAPVNTTLEFVVDTYTLFVTSLNARDTVASLYCRSLGWAGGKIYPSYTDQYGIFPVSNLICSGIESSIFDCPARWEPVFLSNDDGLKAVANCRPKLYLIGSGNSSYGAVVETTRYRTGLLRAQDFNELYHTKYVCSNIGFEEGIPLCCNPYGSLNEQVFPVKLHCEGYTTADCTFEISYTEEGDLFSTDYASVFCYNGSKVSEFSLGVYQGSMFGHIVLSYMNIGGYICSDDWDDADATVTCRQLGFEAGMAYTGEISFRNLKGPFWISNVDCNGTEDSLENCNMTEFGQVTECTNKPGYASVICFGSEGIQYRLVGDESRQGSVEVGLSGKWRTICVDNWTDNNADVLCKMFGYAAGQKIVVNSTKSFWKLSFNCISSSNTLDECLDLQHTCNESDTRAGAFCYKSVKLSTGVGRKKKSGEVLLYHNGEWHTLCADNFTKTSAEVVCRELGFVGGDKRCCSDVKALQRFPKLQTHKVKCSGSEKNVSECLVESPCEGQGLAYVECIEAVPTKAGERDGGENNDSVVIAVVVTIIVLVIVGIITIITIVYTRQQRRRSHNVSVRYSPTVHCEEPAF